METRPSAFKSALMPGVMISIAGIILSLIGFLLFTDMKSQQYYGYATWLVIIALLVYYSLNYRKNVMQDEMSYGQAFSFLFLTNLIYNVIFTVYYFIYLQFIDTGFIERVKEQAADKIASDPRYSQEQIDQAIAMQDKMMTPSMMIIWTLVGLLFFSVIASLILAIFVKKENKQFKTETLD